jgi:uncharacterized protein YhhL (DUF1145 family)
MLALPLLVLTAIPTYYFQNIWIPFSISYNLSILIARYMLILVEDILLCLKYSVQMKQNMYCVWHNSPYILLFQILATSFGLYPQK